jgi:hypothetical protein
MTRNARSQSTGTVLVERSPVTPQPGFSSWSKFARSEWAVALLVLAVYGLFLLRFLGFGGDPRDFIVIGSKFIHRAGPSVVIKPDPGYRYSPDGYDGQFAYFIALDPVNARYYIDDPAYRYTRILYPITARLLTWGQPDLIPYTLIALNWLSIGGGVLALAAWLRRKGCSAWFALVYGLYPGLYISLQRDLNEPMAYALVALAMYLFDFGGRRRIAWAGLSFALAALARESAVLFALIYAMTLLFAPAGNTNRPGKLTAHWRKGVSFLGIALGPFLLYKLFLLLWLKSLGVPSDLSPELVPFRGILSLWPWQTNQIAAVICIILPALICAGIGLWALWKRTRTVEVWALLLNIQLFVVMLAPPPYVEIFGSERITIGVVLAACFCLPSFDRLTGKRRWWFWSSGLLWQALLPTLVLLTAS